MLLKDLLAIKPGSYIKGFKFMNDEEVKKGRQATFDLDGWKLPANLKGTEYTVRTPWYIDPFFTTYNGKEVYDLLYAGEYKTFEEDDEEAFGWDHMEWASFKADEPVGIHLGTYGLVADDTSGGILLYTKILRNDGQVGFVALTARNIGKDELQLL